MGNISRNSVVVPATASMEEKADLDQALKEKHSEVEESLKYLRSTAATAHQESKVGKKLSEATQKAVISLVLTMLLSSAFLQTNLYVEEPTAFTIGLQMESMLTHHFWSIETPVE